MMTTRASLHCKAAAVLLLALAVQHVTADNVTTEYPPSTDRERRQAISTPQLVPGPPGALNVPIPTNIAVFGGSTLKIDQCPRDEVTVEDGSCQQLLTQGNCSTTEYVLLNPKTDRGYCAPRLCPPDRVFVFSTQLCHDPRETNICPPGRELYESSYGTPVCQCPDGTYEGDDDLDDDVCDPLLGAIANCPPGQVFWFRDFNLGPECVPDPCGGLNTNRGPNDLPFIPSLINGRCFQMGSSTGVCPKNTWYGLALDSLKGVCATLQEFGYNVFEPNTLNTLITQLGNPITGNNEQPLPTTGSVGTIIGFHDEEPIRIVSASASAGGGQVQASVSLAPKPIEQISQIQQQIGVLQKQLIRLQQTLDAQSTSPPGMSMSGRAATLNTAPSTAVVIRARLESQFTETSPVAPFQRTQINSPQPLYTSPQPATSFVGRTPAPTFHVSLKPKTPQVNTQTSIQQSYSRPSPYTANSIPRPQSSIRPNFNSQTSNRRISFPNQNPQNFIQQAPQPAPRQQQPSSSQITHQTVRQNIQPQPQQNTGLREHANQKVQIELQPLDFVHIQPVLTVSQTDPRDQFTAFGQQFPQGSQGQDIVNSVSEPSFRQGIQALTRPFELHGGGPSFIPSDDYDDFLDEQRKKRAISPSLRDSRTKRAARKRRSPLPHASPSNVFESRLLGCRGGAVRDINAKCRNVVLPPRLPKKRTVRAAPPVKPMRPCAGAFNIFRQCVSQTDAQSSVNAFALG